MKGIKLKAGMGSQVDLMWDAGRSNCCLWHAKRRLLLKYISASTEIKIRTGTCYSTWERKSKTKHLTWKMRNFPFSTHFRAEFNDWYNKLTMLIYYVLLSIPNFNSFILCNVPQCAKAFSFRIKYCTFANVFIHIHKDIMSAFRRIQKMQWRNKIRTLQKILRDLFFSPSLTACIFKEKVYIFSIYNQCRSKTKLFSSFSSISFHFGVLISQMKA